MAIRVEREGSEHSTIESDDTNPYTYLSSSCAILSNLLRSINYCINFVEPQISFRFNFNFINLHTFKIKFSLSSKGKFN